MELPPNPYVDIPSLLQWKIGVKREFQHLCKSHHTDPV